MVKALPEKLAFDNVRTSAACVIGHVAHPSLPR
jgi:hypothetical protein